MQKEFIKLLDADLQDSDFIHDVKADDEEEFPQKNKVIKEL